ncbi:MAG: acetate kinase [Eubacterium sp.]|nr:acetate kinase [Eubacterium sp.]MBQ8981287.1 acetate kinase [Eubacterium sp.]MBR1530616.1 acetate kinase [Eubacterium sp.]MBR2278558.1 acetate kinase [Eubacterium sp.]
MLKYISSTEVTVLKILVINCGSSSLKYQLMDMTDESVLCKGAIERIGLKIEGGEENVILKVGGEKFTYDKELPTHTDAFNEVKHLISEGEHKVVNSFSEIDAIGHRVVQGGDKYKSSVLVTDEVVEAIKELSPLAPLHNPANLQGYEACVNVVGKDVPQVFVFDTAFHSTMPAKAYMYAIPYEYYEKYGVRKYGFHGTSHKFVSHRVADKMGVKFEELKTITCHLGNGSSIAAVKNGEVIDTSMGFTPLDGFMMGTRSGAVDPSAVTFIMKKENLTPDDMDTLLNKKSGVNAVSGVSSDDRDICAAQDKGNERAILAHEMQAYQIAKFIGSYVAAMNGVDAIVFTGGIGENGVWLRSKICSYLGYLGVEINEEVNASTQKGAEAELTKPEDKVRVFILATDEELMIAQDTKEIVSKL